MRNIFLGLAALKTPIAISTGFNIRFDGTESFVNGVIYSDITELISAGKVEFSRLSDASYFSAVSNSYVWVGSDQPRVQNNALLLEPERTNYYNNTEETITNSPNMSTDTTLIGLSGWIYTKEANTTVSEWAQIGGDANNSLIDTPNGGIIDLSALSVSNTQPFVSSFYSQWNEGQECKLLYRHGYGDDSISPDDLETSSFLFNNQHETSVFEEDETSLTITDSEYNTEDTLQRPGNIEYIKDGIFRIINRTQKNPDFSGYSGRGELASIKTANTSGGSTFTSDSHSYKILHYQIELGNNPTSPIKTVGNVNTRYRDELNIKPTPGTYDITIQYKSGALDVFTGVNITASGWELTGDDVPEFGISSIVGIPVS